MGRVVRFCGVLPGNMSPDFFILACDMRCPCRFISVLLAILFCYSLPGTAAGPQNDQDADLSAGQRIDFAHDVLPILVTHCHACRGPEKQQSNFRLHSFTQRQIELGRNH
jgi:hypothetical protein